MVQPDAAPGSRVRVLNLTRGLAGAYAGKLLYDSGLDVVVAEPTGGHPLRRRSLVLVTDRPVREGLLFAHLTDGQEFVDLPPGPLGDDAVDALVEGFDAVLCGSPPEGADDPALAPKALRARRDELIVVSISPFGLQGPWRDRPATEFTLQAMSGGMAARGSIERPPVGAGGQHGDWVAGPFAAAGLLVSLHRRDTTGGGDLVDVSGFESVVSTQMWNPLTYTGVFGYPWYMGGRVPLTPGDIEPTRDGMVGFSLVNSIQHWHDFCAMIGQPQWADDPALDPPASRRALAAELLPHIREWTSARTTDEIVELASLFRIPVAPIGNGAILPVIEPFVSSGTYQPDSFGTFLRPTPAFRVRDGKGSRQPIRMAPRSDPRPATSDDDALPFSGLRILDFTAFWAGPSATQMFAMLGAEVIHVESPRRPDGGRHNTPRPAGADQWWEWSPTYLGTNSDKLGIAVDMATAAGRDLARELVAVSDVVVENFSTRVIESWGLGFDELRRLRSDIVMVRMPAFGLDGPWRDRTGFAMTMEQISGMAWITGHPDGPPTNVNGPCDPLAGAHASLAILVGLAERERTGEAVFVEVPMIATALNITAEQVIEYSGNGVLMQRMGNRSPHICPQNLYASGGSDPEGTFVALSVDTDERWAALREALGGPDWARDPELSVVSGRWARRDRIDAELAEWFLRRTASESEQLLVAAGVPCAAVVVSDRLAQNPQLQARGFIEELTDPVTGRQNYGTYPAKFERGPAALHRYPAPTLGRDNARVVLGLLGRTAEEYERLVAEGVIADHLTSG
jgi:crotonobetainyl-CoA:carnitine CoA-transferase CaiB-like acyl-CoA transferase